MRRVMSFVGVVAAVCLVGGVVAASASAEALPNILPVATAAANLTGTSSSGISEFESSLANLISQKSEGTFTGESAKLGKFHISFLEVTLLGESCKDLEDNVLGQVLMLGEFHVRHYNKGTALPTAIIFLIKELHFECGVILITLKGCMAAAVSPENTLTKTLTVTLTTSKKDNTIIKVLNEANTAEENCELLAKVGAGAFALTAVKTTQTITGFKQNGKAVEVLVMPL